MYGRVVHHLVPHCLAPCATGCCVKAPTPPVRAEPPSHRRARRRQEVLARPLGVDRPGDGRPVRVGNHGVGGHGCVKCGQILLIKETTSSFDLPPLPSTAPRTHAVEALRTGRGRGACRSAACGIHLALHIRTLGMGGHGGGGSCAAAMPRWPSHDRPRQRGCGENDDDRHLQR